MVLCAAAAYADAYGCCCGDAAILGGPECAYGVFVSIFGVCCVEGFWVASKDDFFGAEVA